ISIATVARYSRADMNWDGHAPKKPARVFPQVCYIALNQIGRANPRSACETESNDGGDGPALLSARGTSCLPECMPPRVAAPGQLPICCTARVASVHR